MQDLVQIAKIFSDINRVKILSLILKEKEVCVCEICDTLCLSQPLVSRHLKQMKTSSILEIRKEGKWIHYSLCNQAQPFILCLISKLKEYEDNLPTLISCSKR